MMELLNKEKELTQEARKEDHRLRLEAEK